jgi:hypothetical protein
MNSAHATGSRPRGVRKPARASSFRASLLAACAGAAIACTLASIAQAQPGVTRRASTPTWPAPESLAPSAAGESVPAGLGEADALVEPLALYPDGAIIAIFRAAQQPLEVVKAARWLRAGNAVENAHAQPWFGVVRGLIESSPALIEAMDADLERTQRLGELAQSQPELLWSAVDRWRSGANQRLDAQGTRAGTDAVDGTALFTQDPSSFASQPSRTGRGLLSTIPGSTVSTYTNDLSSSSFATSVIDGGGGGGGDGDALDEFDDGMDALILPATIASPSWSTTVVYASHVPYATYAYRVPRRSVWYCADSYRPYWGWNHAWSNHWSDHWHSYHHRPSHAFSVSFGLDPWRWSRWDCRPYSYWTPRPHTPVFAHDRFHDASYFGKPHYRTDSGFALSLSFGNSAHRGWGHGWSHHAHTWRDTHWDRREAAHWDYKQDWDHRDNRDHRDGHDSAHRDHDDRRDDHARTRTSWEGDGRDRGYVSDSRNDPHSLAAGPQPIGRAPSSNTNRWPILRAPQLAEAGSRERLEAMRDPRPSEPRSLRSDARRESGRELDLANVDLANTALPDTARPDVARGDSAVQPTRRASTPARPVPSIRPRDNERRGIGTQAVPQREQIARQPSRPEAPRDMRPESGGESRVQAQFDQSSTPQRVVRPEPSRAERPAPSRSARSSYPLARLPQAGSRGPEPRAAQPSAEPMREPRAESRPESRPASRPEPRPQPARVERPVSSPGTSRGSFPLARAPQLGSRGPEPRQAQPQQSFEPRSEPRPEPRPEPRSEARSEPAPQSPAAQPQPARRPVPSIRPRDNERRGIK